MTTPASENRQHSDLVAAALGAAAQSYAPYSSFRVGAALLASDGSIVTGVNVENRSYGLTICAERVAFGTAIARGLRSFVALAVASPDASYPLPPCGACRQVIGEFVEKGFPIIYSDRGGDSRSTTLGELLPFDSLHELRDSSG